MGVTVVMGLYLGEKKEGKVGQVVGGAIWLFLVLAFIIAAAMLVFARPLAVLMHPFLGTVPNFHEMVNLCFITIKIMSKT